MERQSWLGRWWQFTSERFPLGSHVPMVIFFTLGNFALATRLNDGTFDLGRYVLAFVLALSFFFRLRCFDEIKDFDVDVAVNPTRPLARGVLSIPQVKRMIYGLTIAELGLASCSGPAMLYTHGLAVAYSFLMYREFFIGKFLRPHLTTYAVTHTFVSMLLGWSIAAQATGLGLWDFHEGLLLLGLVNWALFNLFEFARKTFAPEEERPNVESYSSLFGPLGASALSLSQIGIALWLVSRLPPMQNSEALGPGMLDGQLLLAFLPLFGGLFYVVRRHQIAAKFYRGVTSAYLVLFYVLLAWQGLG